MTTIPTSNLYGVAIGAGSNYAPIYENIDPGPYNINYPLYQQWVNLTTSAIWVLEALLPSNGVITAQWRAIGPIVLQTFSPTSANYQYPLGQTWLNTANNHYWVLVNVTGTTATWFDLTSAVAGGVLSLSDGESMPVKAYPDLTGNIQLADGSGISTIATTNTITISVTGGGFAWVDVTSSTQAMAANTGYVVDDSSSLVTLTLPATAVLGDTYIIQGKSADGWKVAQNAGQTINVGSGATTTGVTGYIASTNQWDSVTITCVTANTTFACRGVQGVITRN